MLLAAASALLFLGDGVGQSLAAVMREGLELTRAEALDESQLAPALLAALYHAGLACLPLLGIGRTWLPLRHP